MTEFHDLVPTISDGDRPLTALGLMSGTSLDGIDAALVTTDGVRVTEFGAAATYPYPPGIRERLRGLLGRVPDADAASVIREFTLLHAEAINSLVGTGGIPLERIDVIGFHGQTVLHRPEIGQTIQVGDGQLLADMMGIPVVEDFRSADVKAGGQGAPFAPVFHAALSHDLPKPLAVLNVGGVANVTWIGEAETEADGGILAFDTGPGNALIDDWIKATTGKSMDADGRLARSGRVIDERIDSWLRHPYFAVRPPKSLDRDAFAFIVESIRDLSAADGAATLTAFSARSVAEGGAFMRKPPRRWLVCGGGRCNPALMELLREYTDAPVEPVEAVGWSGDALEAQAFAFLAVRSVRGLPLSFPPTTGVQAPRTGGVLRRPAV